MIQANELAEFCIWLRAKGYFIDTQHCQWQTLRFSKAGQKMYIIYHNKRDQLRPDKRTCGVIERWRRERTKQKRHELCDDARLQDRWKESTQAQNMADYEEYACGNSESI